MLATENKTPAVAGEDARLRALAEYAVFDTPPDVDLDRLVELAARMYGVPVAALSLVGNDRLFFKSRFGMQATGIAREGSFCSYAIENDGLFLVTDASKDERFASHPIVADGPKIRFYAGIPLVAPSGKPVGTLCILDSKPRPDFSDDDRKNLEDVAALIMNRLELRRLNQAKQAGHQRFERIAATSPEVIVCADGAGTISHWNGAAESLFGYTASEAIGRPIGFIFPERVRKLQSAEVMSLVRSGTPRPAAHPLQFVALHRDGRELAVELSLSTWPEGKDIGFGAIIRDIGDCGQGERKLFHLAHLDPLTGLPGRGALFKRLAEAATSGAGTLMLLDLDGFKDLNDTLGHAAGDLILNETGDRLLAKAGTNATVSRLGSDEFAVLVCGPADKAHVGELAKELLETLRTPFSVDGETVHISASMGIATFPAHGTNAEQIFANSDLALQRARANLGCGYQFFAPHLRQAAIARRSYESELRRALEKDQFELHFQPQVRLVDASIVGAEALLRWRHPERGLLMPGAFLSLLEASPIAPEVGEWILKTACKEAAVCRQLGHPDFRIGVNLFGAQFNTGELPRQVEAALSDNGLPPEALELEITENIMLRRDESLILPLREMQSWGVRIAFDDYGTGYASLSLLKRYPVTRLKIDRTFVSDVCHVEEDAAIVQAILYLARRFGLDVTAEGIETEAQAEALRMYGCTEAQGYLYGRPMTASQLERRLRDDRETSAA